MRNNILTLLVGFVVMCSLVLLFKIGLDKMTDAEAATGDTLASVDVDMNRRAILYRVKTGDTLWSLADRFYGNGRRWTEIARANEIGQGQGLQSGAVIKIPLAPGDAPPAIEQPPVETAQPASYDEVEHAVNPGQFAIDDNALGITLARIDQDAFPAGVICVARATERQTVTLNVYDAAGSVDAPAVAVYEGVRGQTLCEIRAEDCDGDGEQEIYTIWQSDNGGPLSRILRVTGGKLEIVAETPDDPNALLRLRMKEK